MTSLSRRAFFGLAAAAPVAALLPAARATATVEFRLDAAAMRRVSAELAATVARGWQSEYLATLDGAGAAARPVIAAADVLRNGVSWLFIESEAQGRGLRRFPASAIRTPGDEWLRSPRGTPDAP